MKTIWSRPAPKNKKYVTRDELPHLVRRAIAEMILGGPIADAPTELVRQEPPRPAVALNGHHRRAFPPGSIGAARPAIGRPAIERPRRPQRPRACGHKNRMSACETCTSKN